MNYNKKKLVNSLIVKIYYHAIKITPKLCDSHIK